MKTQSIPPQHQNQQPGMTAPMHPAPEDMMAHYKAAGKLKGRVALVTGGDSGIGRAICIAYAKEGAHVAFVYLSEDDDADTTIEHIVAEGVECKAFKGDISSKSFCNQVVSDVLKEFGALNILVNNAGEQHPQEKLEDISADQLHQTFATNIYGAFYLTQAAIPHMKAADSIINTASIVAYRGHEKLIDYGATKGAIVGFTRALAANLADKKIRVNAVAPGPVWTPLIPSTFDAEDVEKFGQDSPLGRPGQPDEIAPSFVFLASDDSSYMTGQVLHPNGGTIING